MKGGDTLMRPHPRKKLLGFYRASWEGIGSWAQLTEAQQNTKLRLLMETEGW